MEARKGIDRYRNYGYGYWHEENVGGIDMEIINSIIRNEALMKTIKEAKIKQRRST